MFLVLVLAFVCASVSAGPIPTTPPASCDSSRARPCASAPPAAMMPLARPPPVSAPDSGPRPLRVLSSWSLGPWAAGAGCPVALRRRGAVGETATATGAGAGARDVAGAAAANATLLDTLLLLAQGCFDPLPAHECIHTSYIYIYMHYHIHIYVLLLL